jgi:hypothetical protein
MIDEKPVEPRAKSGEYPAPLLWPPALGTYGTPEHTLKWKKYEQQLADGGLLMMGDNPALPKIPEKPTLIDFFKFRLDPHIREHCLQSARLALKAGMSEKMVMACLLHDISAAGLISVDHGFWGAQLIEPYVDHEISWAVRYHQPLRYYADSSVGYDYPEMYIKFFGKDYTPPPYVEKAYQEARAHRWYMSARIVTLHDVYSWDPSSSVTIDDFSDIIGRQFKQPEQGLGFDGSPVAHMWRSMIWPNNAL